jgi:N-acetylmuramoyl-L-alanine amidase
MKRVAAVVVTLLFAACGGPPPIESPPLDDLYRGLADPLPRIDASVLAGRRILIDPGHGGTFRGTVGRDSLEESHVNLGVGLYLWGLLREAGADVYLTRSIDRDFLTEMDSSLTADLQARVDMVDSLVPDVFISIHHNAQPQRDPTVNRVETYYKAGDPASLDLAFAIHRHLMRNLGIDAGEVRQGNYFVLRNVAVPAVLGESSYLTHPPVEDKLRVSRTQQLEAEAYFLGIVDYCRRGLPRVVEIGPADSMQTAVPVVTCTFEDRGGLGIDPDGVSVLVNEQPVAAALSADGRRATYRLPWDARNGLYEVRVTARNLRGNTSPAGLARFHLDHPPSIAAIESSPARVPAGGGSLRVRARILDRRGMPVADGTPVRLACAAARDTTTAAVHGGGVEFALEIPRGVRRAVRVELDCRGARFAEEIPVDAGAAGKWTSFSVCDAASGAAILDASVTLGDSVLVTGSPSGTYGFAGGAGSPVVSAPGYRPAVVAPGDTLRLLPWYDGLLLGRRFVLDPEGGPAREVGVGGMGLSASHVNLRVATYLAGFLHAAGARTLVTRTSEEVPLPEDVARATNRFRADRYLEIRHPAVPGDSAAAVRSHFFPGSANGEKMARTVGEAVARRLQREHRGPSELVTYPLQQTACPAIVIAAPPISDPDEESRLNQARYLREQAYAVFLGVLHHFGVADSCVLDVEVQAPERSDWLVTLDGTWTLVSDESGRVRFECVPAGAHELHLRRGSLSLRRGVVIAAAEAAARLRVDAAAP